MAERHQAEIRVADLVRLNSGGPGLTVVAADNGRRNIRVEWEARKKNQCSLPPACVHRISH